MNKKRAITVGLLVFILTAVFAISGSRAENAEAHTFRYGVCWHNAMKQPDGERFAYLQRCRAYIRRHITNHTRIRYAFRCSRITKNASYAECYQLGKSSMPLAWTIDTSYHKLITKESEWNPRAVNKHSGACGLHQFWPCRAFGSVIVQGSAGHRYIRDKYGSPARAWGYWLANGSY